jgi:uncharacterized integral membrane protein (TIGR00698 family)
VPKRFDSGVATHKLWLEAGIVLMGAGIALDRVVAAGPTVLPAVVVVTAGTLLFVEALARNAFGLRPKLSSLLAAGASICGVSAVVAVAGGIDADEAGVAYASGTILLFDAVTLAVYPAVGSWLGLSDLAFGVWAGTTMFSTGPVTAAGFAVSEAAGQWAVLVKLTRNALIGVVTVGYAAYYVRRERLAAGDGSDERASDRPGPLRALVSNLPPFLVGFVGVVVLGNVALSPAQVGNLTDASNWLFLVAFAGLGLELRLAQFREAGVRPVLAVFASLVTVGGVVLAAVSVLL